MTKKWAVFKDDKKRTRGFATKAAAYAFALAKGWVISVSADFPGDPSGRQLAGGFEIREVEDDPDSEKLSEFVQERNRALQPFDVLEIADYIWKYSDGSTNPMVRTFIECAAGVCKSLLETTSTPKEVRNRAARWLLKHDMTDMHGNKPEIVEADDAE